MNPEYPAPDTGKPFDMSCISHSFRMKWTIPFAKFKSNTKSQNQSLHCAICTYVKNSHNAECMNCGSKRVDNTYASGGFRFGTTTFPTSGLFANQNSKKSVSTSSISVIERSILFDVKDLKIYPFYFELFCEDSGSNALFGVGLKTKGPSNIILEYAVVSLNNRLFCLKVANKTIPEHLKERLVTSDIMKSIYPEPETITIVCRIKGTSDVHSSSMSAMSQGNAMDYEQRLVFECLFPTKEHTPVNSDWETTVSSTPTEAVAKYLSSGELPSLNVELAKQLIADQPCPDELKAWCGEYLMVNLVPENVVGILRIAVEHYRKDLLTQCTEYLATQCHVKKK